MSKLSDRDMNLWDIPRKSQTVRESAQMISEPCEFRDLISDICRLTGVPRHEISVQLVDQSDIGCHDKIVTLQRKADLERLVHHLLLRTVGMELQLQ